jgi:uncharacterized protein YqgQ
MQLISVSFEISKMFKKNILLLNNYFTAKVILKRICIKQI